LYIVWGASYQTFNVVHSIFKNVVVEFEPMYSVIDFFKLGIKLKYTLCIHSVSSYLVPT
jgi:hypothetical protein